VFWQLAKNILKKDTYHGNKTLEKMISLITKCKKKKLSQVWSPVLKGASGRTHALFKGMLKHPCHNDPNLMSRPTLISLSLIDKTA
jgi:hypothetical protein